jgi:Flp pilus assembly pilin Flp
MRRDGIRGLFARPVDIVLRFRHEEGQSLAETALIITFVAIVCVAALTALGAAIPIGYNGVTGAL